MRITYKVMRFEEHHYNLKNAFTLKNISQQVFQILKKCSES